MLTYRQTADGNVRMRGWIKLLPQRWRIALTLAAIKDNKRRLIEEADRHILDTE